MFANVKLFCLILALTATALPETVRFKQRCLTDLVAQVPGILASQNRTNGRFGQGIWIVTDQNVMHPLATAWSLKDPANPYYRDPRVLEAIMAAGDALIADQDPTGQWEFRKKDGSTWGQTYMPWTYSRWIRAYARVREAMPAERRARWDKALRLGYTGIARLLQTNRVQNIPAHHAMGLWFAAEVFKEPAWRDLAATYLRKVAAEQSPEGYWTEHKGPVVIYGFVYVDALGTYYAASHDPAVLPALRKTAVFHSYFTYPDGTDVETIDERNPYLGIVRMPNVGFTFSPEGRGFVARKIALLKGPIPADEAASLLQWGEEGEGVNTIAGDFDFTLGNGEAAVRRRGPWFLVVSAMTAEQSTSRWIQDRQNFVSVYHDKVGLILGGGNTKMQPLWSNFTLGDVNLLRHRAGDRNPTFIPPAGLVHVPKSAKLLDFGVELDYGSARGRIRLAVTGETLQYIVSGDPALAAHVTFLPRGIGKVPESPSESMDIMGVRIGMPPKTVVRWPVLPHNPYTKDGHASPEEAHIVLDLARENGESKIDIRIAN